MRLKIEEYFTDFFRLFFPNLCAVCMSNLLKGEEVMCLPCESKLPLTYNWKEDQNRMMLKMQGRVACRAMAALLVFRKNGMAEPLIYSLKYKGRTDVGEYLGKIFARHLLEPDSVIRGIDLVIPLPLHWKKERKRGYNQCEPVARAIAEIMQVPCVTTAMRRTEENITQTRLKRYDRWGNVEGIFEVVDEAALKNKHVLLVDDVFTTGATSEACMQAMVNIPGTSVSFVALGCRE